MVCRTEEVDFNSESLLVLDFVFVHFLTGVDVPCHDVLHSDDVTIRPLSEFLDEVVVFVNVIDVFSDEMRFADHFLYYF